MRPGTRLQEGKPSKRPPVSVSAAPASPPGATRTLSLGPMPPRGPSPRASAPGSGAGSHLAHEVREVEYGHDEDGQPLAQDAVADLGLKTREQAQRDEIGHGDGQHVGPDDAGHHVAVQQQGCGRRRGSEAGSPKAPPTAGAPPRAQTRRRGPARPHLGRRASCAGFSAEARRSACRLPRRRSLHGLGCPLGTRHLPGLGLGAPGGRPGRARVWVQAARGLPPTFILARRPANTPSSSQPRSLCARAFLSPAPPFRGSPGAPPRASGLSPESLFSEASRPFRRPQFLMWAFSQQASLRPVSWSLAHSSVPSQAPSEGDS